MKKKIWCLLAALMMLGTTMTAQAEHYYGAEDWEVYFDGSEMVSNFTDAQMSETVHSIQPGDDVLLQVNLKNKHSVPTDWYMTNEVISTLEESVNVAEGGAYTYLLKYYDTEGKETVLYDSEVVGGEEDTTLEGEGLHQATNALEEYYYLDRLGSGESGRVTLFVGLEGETQGNDYQDTLAQLKMNFAVELVSTVTPPSHNPGGSSPSPRPVMVASTKTGDASPILLFSGLALAAGVVLLIIALAMKKSKLLAIAIAVPMLAGISSGEALAAERAEYTYQITFHAGNIGTFTDLDGLLVSNDQAVITLEEDRLVISGLKLGDEVSFNAQENIKLDETNKHYVQGVRLSGYDNDTVAASVFEVERDEDFVVAYGIKGNMASYTIKYQDANGATLAPDSVYYGNVGDKPVIPYLYIEGYNPRYVGLTKTLSANTADNVFVFVYDVRTAVEVPGDAGGEAGGETGGDAGEPEAIVGGAGTGVQTPGGTQPPAGGAGGNAQPPADETEENAGGNEAGNEGAVTEDAETEEETEEESGGILDLDDEEVPLAQPDAAKDSENTALKLVGAVALVGVSLGLLAFIVVMLLKKRAAK